MKLYFKETTFRDFSRTGYDDVFIDCSLTPYGSEEGSDFTSCWYFVEIDDGFSAQEAIKLGNEAVAKASNTPMSVKEAVKELETRRKKKSKS